MYLDTAILVKLLVRERDSAFYAALVGGELVWSSQITVTESLSALLRKEREGMITSTHGRKAWRQIEQDIAARRLNLVPLGAEVLTRANRILEACHPEVALRSLDAIHVASAEQCQSWPLCSNDIRVREAATRLDLPLSPLPSARPDR